VIKQDDWKDYGINAEPTRLNYQAIAKAAETSEATIVYVLKQIIVAIQQTAAKDYQVKLNMRVGWLKFINERMFFDKLSPKDV